MIRIGIVGSDNTHGLAIARIANIEEDEHHEPGCRVTMICGDEEKQTKKTAENGRIEKVVAEPREMLGKVDAVIVVYRHGHRHPAAARPFLEAGMPVFVDKPLASSVDDAEEILNLAEKHKAPVTSFSTLSLLPAVRKFIAEMTAPRETADGKEEPPAERWVFSGGGDFRSEYDGIFFYGPHTAEPMVEALGCKVRAVTATDAGNAGAYTVAFPDNRLAVAVVQNNVWDFHFTAYAAGKAYSLPVDTSAGHLEGLRLFKRMVETREQPFTRERMLTPIRILAAAQESFKTGQTVVLE